MFGLLPCSEGDFLGHIKSMMAANYHDRYYRVLVTGKIDRFALTLEVSPLPVQEDVHWAIHREHQTRREKRGLNIEEFSRIRVK